MRIGISEKSPLKVAGILAVLMGLIFTLDLKALPGASLENDTLTLSNSLIERKFLWNNGELISICYLDKQSGRNLLGPSDNPSFDFNMLPKKATFESKRVKSNSMHDSYLEATVLLDYGSFRLKRVFKISDDVPAVVCNHYIWIDKSQSITELQKLLSKPVELDRFSLKDIHPKYKAVEFFDQTDAHNNLVRTVDAVPFRTNIFLKGNILQACSSDNKNGGIFVLKEAPCSSTQLDYPGHDFKIYRNTVTVDGLGLPPDHLIRGKWVNLYGVVVGCYDGTELGFMQALRKYQGSIRKTIPERDEMIMMNTWGDRNQDANINEEFLKTEIDACKQLGVTHFQIDDGWQEGLSRNSASKKGKKWETWKAEDWTPNKERLPNGFSPIVNYARKNGVEMGLWFNPSSYNSLENWKRDAQIILDLYHAYQIRYFKIDGIQLPDKLADHRLSLFFEKIMTESNGEIVLIPDATAGQRIGYHYRNQYGPIFLENRYTDWRSYYPHWTLRNLWQLSAYVPPQNLQIEFLNKWRNRDLYGKDDLLAPGLIPFEYQFAITMMAQPLAWFEGSGLPEEGFKIAPVIKKYRSIQADLHSGSIFPIGNEPSGYSWSGFQSILNDQSGYILVFREKNPESSQLISTWLPCNSIVLLEPVLGEGIKAKASTDMEGNLALSLPHEFAYCLYKYHVVK